MLLKQGDLEDIVNVFEPAPEVQSLGCLPYALYHPERSYKPGPKLPSTCQVKCLRRE